MKCNQYFDINNFNVNYTNDNKLSLLLLNIRFIKIEKKSTLTKNIIVGCIYSPRSYPLHYFNELHGEILCNLESEKKNVYIT